MTNAWDIRPRQPIGDPTESVIYVRVGAALTQWEALESSLAELFDASITEATSVNDSNRAAFHACRSVSSSSARTELVTAAAPRALQEWPDLVTSAADFLNRVSKFGARRNEIAHGMVLNLGEFGHYLCPNNLNPNKWNKEGHAKYQYTSDDILHYAQKFLDLRSECDTLVESIYKRRSQKNDSQVG